MTEYTRRPPTEEDLARIFVVRERHRATGCRVFDAPTAKCTCPESDES